MWALSFLLRKLETTPVVSSNRRARGRFLHKELQELRGLRVWEILFTKENTEFTELNTRKKE